MDSGGILDVAIAEAPVVPALPVHSMAFFLFFGLLAAGASSGGIAFVVDHASPAFRTPDEITAYLDVPVLASLPSRSEVQP
jgi:capsular polysaccharide biosynthesis protein